MTLRDSDDVPAFSSSSHGTRSNVASSDRPRRSRSRSPSAVTSLSGLVARIARGGGDDCGDDEDLPVEFSGPAERRPSASSLDAGRWAEGAVGGGGGATNRRPSGGGRGGGEANRRPSGGSLGGMSHPGMIAAAADLYSGAPRVVTASSYTAGDTIANPPPPGLFGKLKSISLFGGHDMDGDRTPLDHVECQPNLAPINYRSHSQEEVDDHQRWETRSARSHSSERSGRSGRSGMSHGSTDSVAIRFTKRVTMTTVVALVITLVFASFFVLSKNKAMLNMSAGTRPSVVAASGGAAETLSGNPSGGQPPGEMPFPPSANGQSYAYSLPRSMAHLADVTSPRRASHETPLLLHVPMVGGVPEGVAVRCLGKVGAVSNGNGGEYEGQPLEIIDVDGHRYVNVDALTPQGLSRASSLNLASSRLADFVSTPLLHPASSLLFDSSNQGRLFAMVRHPIDRAVASYRHLIAADPYLGQMTLEEYAQSPYAEGDWMTRFLSDHSNTGGPVTEAHASMAKEVLRRKAAVGLYEEAEDSLRRMRAYFGWAAENEEDYAMCQRQVLSGRAGGGGPEGAGDDISTLKSRSHDGLILREGDAAYAALAERNRYDLELYRYARQLFAVQADLPLAVAEELSPAEEERRHPQDRNCVENGKFTADPPHAGWYAVRSTLQTVPGVEGNALQSYERDHQVFGGAWQNLRSGCLRAGEWYRVEATVRATLAGTADEVFVCDPTVLFDNDPSSCPGIGLRAGSGNGDMREVAYAVGPFNAWSLEETGGWFRLHGTFEATSDVLAKRVSLFVSRAPPRVDIAVDAVEVTPVGLEDRRSEGVPTCASPVINGDAETGDHRGWFVRGPARGAGRIEMAQPGFGGSKFAFRHVGRRDGRYRGMLQSLDASCFAEGTAWSIAAQFRYFKVAEDGSGKLLNERCRKDNPRAANSCPVFALDFLSREGDVVETGPLINESPEEVNVGGWNEIRNTFVVSAEMALRPTVLLYVRNVDPGYVYELDAVKMSPL